ncbi:DUF1003 domain-containing protein [Altererythrobacter sp. TH136]|uniref:DUF1003 domain-containing protein n=1 Tax=Altererythrobacter sp. TH136 TaxID=2067415 RepID=UPI00116456DC|nr:DUF1003 domain-containing protein [Altererythrobacter sp. TH136]QDM40496.1 DUF1003 domain-containing protein [Altererythrobacter sp. TH136]
MIGAADPETLARELLGRELHELDDEEQAVICRVAAGTYSQLDADEAAQIASTFGDRLADRVARVGGSWGFILFFACVLLAWVLINAGYVYGVPVFDRFPYIFLNLMLSMLAAMQAPVIMMSQNRQSKKDRITARHDYEVNLRTQLEIVRLSRKLDKMVHLAIREAKKAEDSIEEVAQEVRKTTD